MYTQTNTCEECNKEYNFGNPYLCSDCITDDYYSDDDSEYHEDDYSSIDDLFNNI